MAEWHLRYFPVGSSENLGTFVGEIPRVGETVLHPVGPDGQLRGVLVGQVVHVPLSGTSNVYVYVESPEQEETRKARRRREALAELDALEAEAKEQGIPLVIPPRLRGYSGWPG